MNTDKNWFSQFALLLTLAGLPLADGFFLNYLTAEAATGVKEALIFGMTAFSGAGCVGAAMQLTGNWQRRFLQVLLVYIIVSLGAIFEYSFYARWSQPTIDRTWRIVSGVFLLGLGLRVSGIPLLNAAATRMRFDVIPRILALVVAASVILFAFGALDHTQRTPVFRSWVEIAAALACGLGLTLFGMVLGMRIDRERIDTEAMHYFLSFSLILIGLTVMGVHVIPGNLILFCLVAAFSFGLGPPIVHAWKTAGQPSRVKVAGALTFGVVLAILLVTLLPSPHPFVLVVQNFSNARPDIGFWTGDAVAEELRQHLPAKFKVEIRDVLPQPHGDRRFILTGAVSRDTRDVAVSVTLQGKDKRDFHVTRGRRDVVDSLANWVGHAIGAPKAVHPRGDSAEGLASAWRAYEGRRFEEAQVEFRKMAAEAITGDQQPSAHLGLSLTHAFFGADEAAIAHADTALRRVDNVTDRFLKGRIVAHHATLVTHDYARAEAVLTRLIDEDSSREFGAALLDLARVKWFYCNDVEYASRLLERLIELYPRHPFAYNDLAYCYARLGKARLAIWAAEEQVSIAPREHNPEDTLGDMLMLSGDIEEAIGSYKRAIDLNPNEGYVSREKLARIALLQGDTALCRDHLDIISHQDSREYRRRARAARVAATVTARGLGKQDLVAASDSLRSAIRADLDMDTPGETADLTVAHKYFILATIHDRLRNSDQALDFIEQATRCLLASHRTSPMHFWDYRVKLLLRAGREDEANAAVDTIKKSLRDLDPCAENDSYPLLMAEAYVLQRKGDKAAWVEAARRIEVALKQRRFSRMSLELARCWRGAGDLSKAREVLSDFEDGYRVYEFSDPLAYLEGREMLKGE